MADEINPSQQRGVSVDVLAERLTNQNEITRAGFDALHHHFAALEVKVDNYGDRMGAIETALHEHVAQQHHIGTRDRLLEMSKTLLENERRFSEIDKVFAANERDRLIEKAAVEARTKQRNQGLTVLDKAVALALLMVPIAITLVRG